MLTHRAGRLEAQNSFSSPGPSGHQGWCPKALHPPWPGLWPWPQQTLKVPAFGESRRRGRWAGSPGVGHWQGQTNPAGWAGTGWASFNPCAPPLQEVVTLLLALRTAWGNEQRGQGPAVTCSKARPPLHQSSASRSFCISPWRSEYLLQNGLPSAIQSVVLRWQGDEQGMERAQHRVNAQ